MLRRGSVLVGMAVLLSLLFPVQFLLKAGGVDPQALRVPGVDLAALWVLAGVIPAMLMYRDGALARRIPRWSAWVVLLAASSAAYLVLHVDWTLDLVSIQLRELAVSTGLLPTVSHLALVEGLELASRIGVLVALVGVLMHLDAPGAQDEAPPAPVPAPRRRKK